MTLAWHSKTFARRVVRSSSISIYVVQLASSIPQQVLLIISPTTRKQLSRIRSDQSLRKEAATYLRRISRSNGFSHGSISNSFSICSSSSWLLEFAIAEWHVALNLGVLCSRDCLVKTCVWLVAQVQVQKAQNWARKLSSNKMTVGRGTVFLLVMMLIR